MGTTTPTREQAFELLKEFNQTDSLIKHALSVEAVMRHFARKRGEDEEKWGVIGLVHDLDYEKFSGPALPQDRRNPAAAAVAGGVHPCRGEPRLGGLLGGAA